MGDLDFLGDAWSWVRYWSHTQEFSGWVYRVIDAVVGATQSRTSAATLLLRVLTGDIE